MVSPIGNRPGAPPPLQIPLAGGGAITLSITRALTAVEWDTLTMVLGAMKPSYVVEERHPTGVDPDARLDPPDEE